MNEAVAYARREAVARGYQQAHEPACPLRTTDAPASACQCDSLAFVIAVSCNMAAERDAAVAVTKFFRQLEEWY